MVYYSLFYPHFSSPNFYFWPAFVEAVAVAGMIFSQVSPLVFWARFRLPSPKIPSIFESFSALTFPPDLLFTFISCYIPHHLHGHAHGFEKVIFQTGA